MRVLIIPSAFPCKPTPTDGAFVREHARVTQSFADVLVCHTIVLQGDKTTFEKLRYEENGYIVDLWILSINKFLRLLLIHKVFPLLVLSIFHASKCINKFNADVVIAHQIRWAGLITVIIKKIYSMPFLSVNHATPTGVYKKYFYNKLLRLVHNEAAMTCYVSEPQYRKYRDINSSHRFCLLGNPVDTVFYQPVIKKEKRESPNNIKILFIGSPAERKGLDILYKSLILIMGNNNKKIRVICLVKNFSDYWVREISKSPLATNFEFVKFVDKKTLRNIIYESDFLALPSKNESFSYAVAEALSCGKPVVTTACGGPEWFVTKEVGIVCEPDNVESFSKGLSFMIDNFNQYDPWKLHNHIEQLFSFETIANKMKALLAGIPNHPIK